MPVCTFIEKYEVEQTGSSVKITVVPSDTSDIAFAAVVRRAFPDLRVESANSGSPRRPLIISFTLEQDFIIRNCDHQAAEQVKKLLHLLSRHITIVDTLDESYALAPHSLPPEDEDEKWKRTEIGSLVYKAKDYHQARAFRDQSAANSLAQHLHTFITTHPRYNGATVIAPAPSSNPANTFNLPVALSAALARALGKRLVSPKRVRAVPQLKEYDEGEAGVPRAEIQSNSIQVGEDLNGLNVIIIDDLYRSGSTLEEVARACRAAKASTVFGITLTKNAKDTRGMDLGDWPWG